jgi:hypothetical protein
MGGSPGGMTTLLRALTGPNRRVGNCAAAEKGQQTQKTHGGARIEGLPCACPCRRRAAPLLPESKFLHRTFCPAAFQKGFPNGKQMRRFPIYK